MNKNTIIPNLIIIGDSAYDTNKFICEDSSHFLKLIMEEQEYIPVYQLVYFTELD